MLGLHWETKEREFSLGLRKIAPIPPHCRNVIVCDIEERKMSSVSIRNDEIITYVYRQRTLYPARVHQQ